MASLVDIRDCDIVEVLDALDIEHRTHGRRESFLCPCHDDNHLGSCFVNAKRNRWHCYACGAGGDVISLVRNVNGMSFESACSWISRNILGEQMDADISVPRRKTLSPRLLTLIGLSPEDGPVYVTEAHYDDAISQDELLEEWDSVEWAPAPTEDDNDLWLCKRLVVKKPLEALMTEDEFTYRWLIRSKAQEAKIKYKEMIQAAETGRQDSPRDYYCGIAAKIAGLPCWRKTLEKMIRECDDLIIEFSDVTEKSPEEKPKNLFGHLRVGVSI